MTQIVSSFCGITLIILVGKLLGYEFNIKIIKGIDRYISRISFNTFIQNHLYHYNI